MCQEGVRAPPPKLGSCRAQGEGARPTQVRPAWFRKLELAFNGLGTQGSFLLSNWLLGRYRPGPCPTRLRRERLQAGRVVGGCGGCRHSFALFHGGATTHLPVLPRSTAQLQVGLCRGRPSPSTLLREGACSRQLGPPTPFQATSLPKSLLQTQVWVFPPLNSSSKISPTSIFIKSLALSTASCSFFWEFFLLVILSREEEMKERTKKK